MRTLLIGTAIASILLTTIPSMTVAAFSQFSDGVMAEPAVTTEAYAPTQSTYLEKVGLSDLSAAVRTNRANRQTLVEMMNEDSSSDILARLIKALDVRYSIFSAVGSNLIRATTQEEVLEASAMVSALLEIHTNLDEEIAAINLIMIEESETAEAHLGTCPTLPNESDAHDC